MEIRRLQPGDDALILGAPQLFDEPPKPRATARFLQDPGHHILVALDDGGSALGFVTGVETTHPDKGTEMFLYELSVDEPARRNGIGRALVQALAGLARERGCYGMWTGTEPANVAAQRTYESAGATLAPAHLIIEWSW